MPHPFRITIERKDSVTTIEVEADHPDDCFYMADVAGILNPPCLVSVECLDGTEFPDEDED